MILEFLKASNVLSVALDTLDDLTERQLVVHFEVMPPVTDETDPCSDVRFLDSLVLTADDGTATFTEDVGAHTNVNLSLPVGINMNELLNGTLEVVSQSLPCQTPTAILSSEEMLQLQRGKVKIPALKRPTQNRKICPDNATASQNSSGDNVPKRFAPTDDSANLMLFEQWLSSVTERINQTMHFGMPGTPDPLVYQIPHSFFDCLRDKIAAFGRKKRMPCKTEVFQKRDRPPFATLTRYTWNLDNAGLVKQIFDTPLVSCSSKHCKLDISNVLSYG